MSNIQNTLNNSLSSLSVMLPVGSLRPITSVVNSAPMAFIPSLDCDSSRWGNLQ